MSDASTVKTGDGPQFSEREQKLILAAMGSLKSGPPDIDMDKFTTLGGFNTKKTASNQWATLKKKLALGTPDAEDNITVKTPKTPSKKRVKAADDDGEEGTATKKAKTPKRKTPAKAVDSEDGVEGDGSPKKRTSTQPRGKKATSAEVKASKETAIKAEDDDDADNIAAANANGNASVPASEQTTVVGSPMVE